MNHRMSHLNTCSEAVHRRTTCFFFKQREEATLASSQWGWAVIVSCISSLSTTSSISSRLAQRTTSGDEPNTSWVRFLFARNPRLSFRTAQRVPDDPHLQGLLRASIKGFNSMPTAKAASASFMSLVLATAQLGSRVTRWRIFLWRARANLYDGR